MIHCIDHDNRHLYGPELASLHRERANCFIDERGWPLRRTGEGEFDQYDDAAAVHLVAFDAQGAVMAACRVRPTHHGGLIPDQFPQLVALGAETLRAPGVYECTRYFCVPAARGARGFAARSSLHLAMIEHVRDLGGHRLVGFVDLPLLTHLRRFSGLRIAPIGVPHAYDDGALTIAFDIGVRARDLRETRARLDLPSRQLFRAPRWVGPAVDMHRWADALAALLQEGAGGQVPAVPPQGLSGTNSPGPGEASDAAAA